MAHFLGILKGIFIQEQKDHLPGRVACEGDSLTGLDNVTASWEGAINVKAYFNKRTGTDWVRISKIKWYGKGIEREIYHGPIGKELT